MLATAEERSRDRASGATTQRGVLYCVMAAPLCMKRSSSRENVPRRTTHSSRGPMLPIFLDVTYPASTKPPSINAAHSPSTSSSSSQNASPFSPLSTPLLYSKEGGLLHHALHFRRLRQRFPSDPNYFKFLFNVHMLDLAPPSPVFSTNSYYSRASP